MPAVIAQTLEIVQEKSLPRFISCLLTMSSSDLLHRGEIVDGQAGYLLLPSERSLKRFAAQRPLLECRRREA